MNFLPLLFPALLLAACAPKAQTLRVNQFHLRVAVDLPTNEPMLRMATQRRMHGAISEEERRQRLGQYYTLIWNDPSGVGKGEVKVLFEYQQGATGSLVKSSNRLFPSSAASGTTEFAIIGDDYFKQGKVTTWKVTLSRGQQILDTKQSYLWR